MATIDRDPEVVEIQQQWLSDYGECRRWIIVETARGYEMHIHDRDNVSPTSIYATKREIAARMLQLLNIGPVAPQTWPEEACIGTLVIAPEEQDTELKG